MFTCWLSIFFHGTRVATILAQNERFLIHLQAEEPSLNQLLVVLSTTLAVSPPVLDFSPLY